MNDIYGFSGTPALRLGGVVAPGVTLKRIQHRLNQLYAAAQNGDTSAVARIAKLESAKAQIAAKMGLQQGLQSAMLGQGGSLMGSGIRNAVINEADIGPEEIAQNNQAMAAQGRRWDVAAPPPSGTQTTVPFVAAGATNPMQNLAANAGAGLIGVTANLVTVAIAWAVVKIRFFTTQTLAAPTGSGAVFQDLRVGGGANLILTEGWTDASQYDGDKDSYLGLRAQPNLTPTNTAQVTVAARAGSAGNEVVIAAFNLGVSVLRDDVFGPGLPGPN